MRKYQSVDKAEVVSREGHRRLDEELAKMGIKSLKTVTAKQREDASRVLDEER